MSVRKLTYIVLALAVVAVGWVLFQRSKSGGADAAKTTSTPSAPVVVTTVSRTPTPVILTASGSVVPDASVAVRSRADGVVDKVLIDDGADVTAGQLLFVLDDRAQVVAVQQAQAVIAKDEANMELAKITWERFAKMPVDEVVSRQTVDNAKGAYDVTVAALKADQAALANAQVLLSYTQITAPIDGRAGFIGYKRGNIIHSTDTTALVVINRVHPVQVTFAIPQRYLEDIRSLSGQGALPITVQTSSGKVGGKLAYIDNSVDITTGTIQIRGVFENKDNRLWPGELITATLTLRDDPNALVVPDSSVQLSQNGPYVWIIKSDKTAELRQVKVDRSVGGMSVLSDGVASGDQVVTEGGFRLASGTHVTIRNPNETASAQGGDQK